MIKNPTTGEAKLADESYVLTTEGSTVGYVSGIIKAYTLRVNELTGKQFWEVDIDCLGLHIRVLADYRLIKEAQIQVGKVLCGEMWNTAFIVD